MRPGSSLHSANINYERMGICKSNAADAKAVRG